MTRYGVWHDSPLDWSVPLDPATGAHAGWLAAERITIGAGTHANPTDTSALYFPTSNTGHVLGALASQDNNWPADSSLWHLFGEPRFQRSEGLAVADATPLLATGGSISTTWFPFTPTSAGGAVYPLPPHAVGVEFEGYGLGISPPPTAIIPAGQQARVRLQYSAFVTLGAGVTQTYHFTRDRTFTSSGHTSGQTLTWATWGTSEPASPLLSITVTDSAPVTSAWTPQFTVNVADLDDARLGVHLFPTGGTMPPECSTSLVVSSYEMQVQYQYPRWRLVYDSLPPLRQYPRDDTLGGAPRQGSSNGSTSTQASARQGWVNTYR